MPEVNRKRHSCGCLTAFDTDDWHSVTIERCKVHQAVVRSHPTEMNRQEPQ